MTRVLHVVERWLEVSAGFVAAHVEHSRHQAVVVATQGRLNREAFPYRPVYSLAALERLPPRLRPRATGAAVDLIGAQRGVAVVHVHFGYPAHAALPLVRRHGVPLVLSLHGEDATALVRRHPHHYEPVIPLTSVVAVPSRYLAEAAAAAGFPADSIRVLPSGVDTEFFVPTPRPTGPPIVAHIGRLVPKKGLDVLIEAWPSVLASAPDAQLHVLGDGPLAHLLADSGSSVVHHIPDPRRRREQVRELLAAAHIVAQPSRTAPDGDAESLLLVNIEAMAAGRPVVSSRHGGIPEYVRDGDNGLLVDEGDVRGLASAIASVLADEALADGLVARGLVAAKALDVRRCAAAVDDVYDELSA